jgi:hypothetical protein
LSRRTLAVLALALLFLRPDHARAWGGEGHRVIAAIARSYLTPATRRAVDDLLARDTDPLTAHNMLDAATWADAWRPTHRETSNWHFVDIELDHADLAAACFGFPAAARPVSAGPAQDCVTDRIDAFAAELAAPETPQTERILALKFVLHLVGDVHQPLHAADNHDRGGNCVLLALGASRTVNLHSYWDTAVVEALGPDAETLAAELRRKVTPADRARWSGGDPRTWALETFQVARRTAYALPVAPGCNRDAAPVPLPTSYPAAAQAAAAVQLEKAGVRLATVLNKALARPLP